MTKMKNSVLVFVVVFVFVATLSNVCFAYSSYGSSEPSGFVIFLWILSGLLGIILFFKVWGMTNDIRKIKNKFLFLDEEYKKEIDGVLQISSLREAVLCGNIDFVKKRLIKHFCYTIESSFNKQIVKMSKQEAQAEKEELMKQSIRPLVDNLQILFDRIGEELPPYIKRMETYNDYYNIFTSADFK